MGNCCVCGKKMGMFEGSSIATLNASMSSYYVCGSCSSKVRSLEQGKGDYFNEFQVVISKTVDDKLKEYLTGLCKNIGQKEIDRLNEETAKRRKEELIQKRKLEFKQKSDENANFILATTGYGFEGYRIIQYKGIISGECVLGTGFLSEIDASISDLTVAKSMKFSNKLKEAKNHALLKLKESCYLQGGNAIIGIDFDYITFASNMIGVVANGTAVIVER